MQHSSIYFAGFKIVVRALSSLRLPVSALQNQIAVQGAPSESTDQVFNGGGDDTDADANAANAHGDGKTIQQ